MSLGRTSTVFRLEQSVPRSISGTVRIDLPIGVVWTTFRDQGPRKSATIPTLLVAPGSIGCSSTYRPRPVNWQGVPTTQTLDNGAKQGKNDFGNIGYGGPAPPKGKPHRYLFKLYALDAVLDLPDGPMKTQRLDAMKGRIPVEGQLMGTYRR